MRKRPRTGWNDEPEEFTSPQTGPTAEEIQKQIDEATKESTERLGLRGSLGRVSTGGARLSPGTGFSASDDGTPKSQIEPDGDVFIGSDLTTPEGTTFMVFANAQDYNAEPMEEGDFLIGDNSDGKSNVKWDASEGQLQFRLGQTIKVYMDTDGSIRAGGGDVTIDEFGITFLNQEGNFGFEDTSGNLDNLIIYSDAFDEIVVKNAVGGKKIRFDIDDAAHNVLNTYFNYGDDGSTSIPTGATYQINGTPHSHGGSVTAATNDNDIYRCANPGGVPAFVGTIASWPGGAVITYNITSGNEGALVPVSTSQLGKLKLRNTTRGDYALISNCVTATNTITLTANIPAGWQVGDTITIASLTVSGGGFSWVDIVLTSGPTGKAGLFVSTIAASGTVGDTVRLHPLDGAFSLSKTIVAPALVAGQNCFNFGLIQLINDTICLSWTGTPTNIVVRESGYTV